MFGRRSKQSRRLAGPSPQAANPAFSGFRFAVSTTEYPALHPHYPGFNAFFKFDGGGEIAIITPFYPPQQALRFRLGDLPANEWVQLKDPMGRPIPIEVFVDPLDALGRWLP
ncbi:MAG: hypothetical protein M3354_07690 [Chloroflexota bacterium]|nr:hypothetical protein [Chloroflexota bacterium]